MQLTRRSRRSRPKARHSTRRSRPSSRACAIVAILTTASASPIKVFMRLLNNALPEADLTSLLAVMDDDNKLMVRAGRVYLI